MSNISTKAFTFSAVYLGDAAPASSVLSRVNTLRTGGTSISDVTPTEYLAWLDEVVVTGEREITISMEFYDDSTDIVDKATLGISLDNDFGDPTDLQKYSLLLVAPDEFPGDNYYFPKVVTLINYSTAYTKDGGVVLPVTFAISSNDTDTVLYYKDTLDNLDSTMGSRSPL